MTRRFIFFFVYLFVFIVLFLTGCGKKDPVVARIGNRASITVSELRKNFLDTAPTSMRNNYSVEDLRQHLERMIERKIHFLMGVDQGVEKDSTYIARMEANRKALYAKMLYESEIVDHIVTEPMIRDFYARMGKKVLIRKITFKVPANGKEDDRIREAAENVLARIHAGESFVSLMRKYSQDDALKENPNGLIGPLTWTKDNDPVLSAAFSLKKGEVSDLIKDKEGYHIIRVVEIKNNKRQNYADIRDGLKKQLQREKSKEISDYVRFYIDSLMQDSHVEWNDETLDLLEKLIKGMPHHSKMEVLGGIKELPADERKHILLTYDSGNCDLNQFYRIMQKLPSRAFYYLNSREAIKRFVNDWLIQELLVPVGERKALYREPEFQKEDQRNREVEIKSIMQVRDSIHVKEPLEEDCLAFYNDNKEDKYLDPDMVKVQEIMVRDSALAQKIAKWVREGVNMGNLAKKYSKRYLYKNKQGIMNPFERGRYDNMGEVAFTLKEGEIAGPIRSKDGKEFSIIKLLDFIPSHVLSYDDIKSRVKADLKRKLKSDMLEKWKSIHWPEYNVMVYDSVLEKMVGNNEEQNAAQK